MKFKHVARPQASVSDWTLSSWVRSGNAVPLPPRSPLDVIQEMITVVCNGPKRLKLPLVNSTASPGSLKIQASLSRFLSKVSLDRHLISLNSASQTRKNWCRATESNITNSTSMVTRSAASKSSLGMLLGMAPTLKITYLLTTFQSHRCKDESKCTCNALMKKKRKRRRRKVVSSEAISLSLSKMATLPILCSKR